MVPRDTTTGGAYEEIVETCIKRAARKYGYDTNQHALVGIKPGGGRHVVDWELTDRNDPDRRGLVSCKYQGTSGTAEEKIAYEVIKLLHAMDMNPIYKHAWLVMGGTGWSPGMIEFVKNHLFEWIPSAKGRVTIFTSTDELVTTEIRIP